MGVGLWVVNPSKALKVVPTYLKFGAYTDLQAFSCQLGMGRVKTQPEQFFGGPEQTHSIFFLTRANFFLNLTQIYMIL